MIVHVPEKGTIAIGSDADLTLWDPERKVTLTQSLMYHGSDHTPYEGIEVTGWPVTTILRGQIIFDDGQPAVTKGFGQFMTRQVTGRL
ncbi:hypothetical protein [Phyllobacterium sp. SB3]|uniref:hypothetical protein n=1 Tax=Phyllobacterium sp. SB3 TaxID=3156073 RepID=UPI0032AE9A91